MTVQRKESPQSMLSKELITKALLELMQEKPYKQINISELTKRADLSRRTFYRHFTTIDEVLDYLLLDGVGKFTEFYLNKHPQNLQSSMLTFFTYWETHKPFLLLLKKNGLLFLLLEKFLPEAHQKLAEKMSVTKDCVNYEYVLCFCTGGMWNLLVSWLNEGATASPAEMSNIADDILSGIK